MIHPHTELRFINEEIGYGIVALKPIPRGTITWVLDKLDRTFTHEQVRGMDPLYQQVLDKFTYRNAQGNYVLCWDNARFVNHSSRSNCLTTAYEFEVAVRDIAAGEELTDDYGYLNLEEPFHAIPEPGSERNVIYPDDLLRYYPQWDGQLLSVFPELVRLEQPLFPLLDRALQEKVRDIAMGKRKMDSILHCYYDDPKVNGSGVRKLVRTNNQTSRVIYPHFI